MTMTWLLFQVKVEGRTQFLSAVCMSCLEGSGGQPVRCRCCTQPWDGSSLVLGTMYSYDIFAAMPCCTERLKVSCSFGVFVIRNDVFLKSTTFWKRQADDDLRISRVSATVGAAIEEVKILIILSVAVVKSWNSSSYECRYSILQRTSTRDTIVLNIVSLNMLSDSRVSLTGTQPASE